MKEAIGGAYLFQIVVLFILLFTAFISLSINYSRAFSVSSEISDIITRHNGVNEDSMEEISALLLETGYRTKGSCDEENGEEASGFIFSGDQLTDNTGNGPSLFCIREYYTGGGPELPDTVYYRVRTFYKLDLPILNSLFEFDVNTNTRQIYYPSR